MSNQGDVVVMGMEKDNDFIGLSANEVEKIVLVVGTLYALHNLPAAQKHDFLNHLHGAINALNLSQQMHTDIVTNYVRCYCKMCKKPFFGSAGSEHCTEKSCKQAWMDTHIFSKIQAAKESQLQRKGKE